MLARFKNWLKDSGTYNRRDEKIEDVLNPFDFTVFDFLRSDDAEQLKDFSRFDNWPARIYRNNFFDGLNNVWKLWLGHHYNFYGTRGRKGLLDILIFPAISRRMLNWIDRQSHFSFLLTIFVRMPLFIIAISLEIVRRTLAACFTIALSPFVAIASIITAPKKSKIRQDIRKIIPIFGVPTMDLLKSGWGTDFNRILGANLIKVKQTGAIVLVVRKRVEFSSPTTAVSWIPVTEKNYVGLKALQTFNICRRDVRSHEALNDAIAHLEDKTKIRQQVSTTLDEKFNVGGVTKKAMHSLVLGYADMATEKQDNQTEPHLKAALAAEVGWTELYEDYNPSLAVQSVDEAIAKSDVGAADVIQPIIDNILIVEKELSVALQALSALYSIHKTNNLDIKNIIEQAELALNNISTKYKCKISKISPQQKHTNLPAQHPAAAAPTTMLPRLSQAGMYAVGRTKQDNSNLAPPQLSPRSPAYLHHA